MRHQVVGFGLRQALLDGTLDTNQTSTELVLSQFADGTYTAVTEVVDVIDLTALLQRSLKGGGKPSDKSATKAPAKQASKASAKKAPAKSAARKSGTERKAA